MTSITTLANPNQIDSRETYIAYREEWRFVYKNLTAAIREEKAARKVGSSDERSTAQSRLAQLRTKAALAMKWLDEAKAKRPNPKSNLSVAA